MFGRLTVKLYTWTMSLYFSLSLYNFFCNWASVVPPNMNTSLIFHDQNTYQFGLVLSANLKYICIALIETWYCKICGPWNEICIIFPPKVTNQHETDSALRTEKINSKMRNMDKKKRKSHMQKNNVIISNYLDPEK